MNIALIYSARKRKYIFYLNQTDEEEESVELEIGSDYYYALIDKSKFLASEVKKNYL